MLKHLWRAGVPRLFWWGMGIREFDPLQKWQILKDVDEMNVLKAVITALRNFSLLLQGSCMEIMISWKRGTDTDLR